MTNEEVEKIYVVIGSSADYDSYANWNVKSFKNKAAADSLCANAKKRADEIFEDKKIVGELYHYYDKEKYGTNEFDPKMQLCGISEAYYEVEELELV